MRCSPGKPSRPLRLIGISTIVVVLALTVSAAPKNASGQGEQPAAGLEKETGTSPEPATQDAAAADPAGEDRSLADVIGRGRELLNERQWPLAIAEFTAAIARFPDSPSGYWFRAKALRQIGRPEAAGADYAEVVRLVDSPTQPAAIRSRAFALLELGRCEQALADLNAALAINPGDADLLVLRGRAHELLDKLPEALNDYSEAIRILPESADAFLRRGNLYTRSGRHQEGLADQKRAVRLGGFGEGELHYHDAESGVGFRFVFVTPGPRWIGYDEKQRTAVAGDTFQLLFGHNATPIHEIQLHDGYFILDREITVAQYEAFQGPAAKGDLQLGPDESNGPSETAADPDRNGPQTGVSWLDAMQFCRAMRLHAGLGIRLPTEIEWECAARQHQDWLYPWGDGSDQEFRAWAARKDAAPRPLKITGSRDVTPNGIHDLAGNVSEWCLDQYKNSLFPEPAPRQAYLPVPFPFGPGHSAVSVTQAASRDNLGTLRRSYRGGSFSDTRYNCQIPVRRAMLGSERSPAIGFRPVLLVRY